MLPLQLHSAQKAFRELRERQIRGLETQSTALGERIVALQRDNTRLLRWLEKLQSDNAVLDASFTGHTRSLNAQALLKQPDSEGKLVLSTSINLHNKPTLTSSSSSRFLDVNSTWDLIQNHPMICDGYVEFHQIYPQLRKLVRFQDTKGPVFNQYDVLRVIVQTGLIN
ncbi:hypothetical protein ANO11243_067000 [Dothideomycetidae sp. 11243]|nr:hypothetical protein ANO11243_067000 [fungal sp. No.11243]